VSHEHAENPWAGQGSVLLDIGGDVGALVVEMPAGLVGVEVEVRATGGAPGGHRPHVAVVERPAGTTTVPSLVFPALAAGTYELCDKGTDTVRLRAAVVGGRVTQLVWTDEGPITPGGAGAVPSAGRAAVARAEPAR
jgi:hypothetical protein